MEGHKMKKVFPYFSPQRENEFTFPCISFQEKTDACLYAEWYRRICVFPSNVYVKGVVFFALFYTWFLFLFTYYILRISYQHTPYSSASLLRILFYSMTFKVNFLMGNIHNTKFKVYKKRGQEK